MNNTFNGEDTEKDSLISFPCDFLIKIIGVSRPSFIEDIKNIILKHYPKTSAHQITFRESENGNYTSITATVFAQNKPELDKLYQELSAFPDVKMVL